MLEEEVTRHWTLSGITPQVVVDARATYSVLHAVSAADCSHNVKSVC